MTIATLKLRDGKELEKQLKRLVSRGVRKVNTKAVREAIKPAASAAKKNAPVGETKALKKGIGRKTKGYKNGNAIGIVGLRKDRNVPHYHLVELGHRIAKGGSLRRERGKRAGQPGNSKREGTVGGFVKGRHFMRRALELNNAKAVGIYTKQLRTGIINEAKKK